MRLAKAEPDHRAEIRRLLAAGDSDGLTRLFRFAPAAGEQYYELLRAGAGSSSPTGA